MRRLWPLHYPSITSDVLQINYQAATSPCWEADLIDESKKLPHGHPSIHSPVSSIQQSVLVSVQGNSYQHYYFSGVVCARVHWQKRTNTQFVFRLWVYESASARRQRWGGGVRRAILTARGWRASLLASSNSTWFHFARTLTNRPGRVHILGGFDANICWWYTALFIVLSSFFAPVNTSVKGFVQLD